MAIKQAQYKITLANGEDIYHFETDDNMVKIVDGNKNVLGTFKEYGMEGKVVTSGAFTDLKVTGIYKVTNLTGLPSGYAIGKMSILSVKAVGRVGNPDLISYDLFSQTGDVYHNVVLGSTPTGWTSGGTTVKNALSTLTNGIGDLTKLNTTAKGSLVNSVNEVSLKLNSTASTLTTLTSDFATFKGHNHDDKYVIKSGDTMNGNLVMSNAKRVQFKSTTGSVVNLIGANEKNEILLGNANTPLMIYGSKATFNGSEIWHEGNDGSGSGLDADKLDGIDSSQFSQLAKENIFTKNQIFNQAVILGSNGSGYNRIIYKDSNNKEITALKFEDNGKMVIQVKDGANDIEVHPDGHIVTPSDITISSKDKWAGLRFSRDGVKKGIGFEIDRGSGNLAFHNWDNDKTGFYFDYDTGTIEFSSAISISGRKLYLQSSTPTGSRKTGDIWIA